jgi:hypothetical protein
VSFNPGANDRSGIVSGAVVCGRINGLYADGWAGPDLELPLYLPDDAKAIELTAYLPEWMPHTGDLTVAVRGWDCTSRVDLRRGLHTVSIPVELRSRSSVMLTLSAAWDVTPARTDMGSTDQRKLAYLLTALRVCRC